MAGNKGTPHRRGLWIDDDSTFTETMRECFSKHKHYDVRFVNDPFGADFRVRECKPDFVVFDLRWKESEHHRWTHDEKVGLKLIEQVKSAFPHRDLLLGFVVSDLAAMGSYRESLRRMPFIRQTFDKQDYGDKSALCDGIVDLVEDHIGELRRRRETYFDWSMVCSSLPTSPLDFIDLRIQADRSVRGIKSPAKWKLHLDRKIDRVIKMSERCLADWYGADPGDIADVVTSAKKVFEFGHSKTLTHGYVMYLLYYALFGPAEMQAAPSEPQGIALRRIMKYLAQNELSPLELEDIERNLSLLGEPIRTYEGRITEVRDDWVLVDVDIDAKHAGSGKLRRSCFPDRELWDGMDVVLEVRRACRDIFVTPHVLTPSVVHIGAGSVPRRSKKVQLRKGRMSGDGEK